MSIFLKRITKVFKEEVDKYWTTSAEWSKYYANKKQNSSLEKKVPLSYDDLFALEEPSVEKEKDTGFYIIKTLFMRRDETKPMQTTYVSNKPDAARTFNKDNAKRFTKAQAEKFISENPEYIDFSGKYKVINELEEI